jgi:hypothetical protein
MTTERAVLADGCFCAMQDLIRRSTMLHSRWRRSAPSFRPGLGRLRDRLCPPPPTSGLAHHESGGAGFTD